MIERMTKWFYRVHRFNQQMFPFFPNVFIFVVQFSVTYFTLLQFLAVTYQKETIIKDIICGAISLVLFAYLFRCFDEVKDYDDDKINFPNRPLVVGMISIKDMYILQISILCALLILNIAIPHGPDTALGFFAVFIFTILASRWFFAKKWIKPSLPLALITHNPVVYLHQLYILSFFEISSKTLLSSTGLFLLSVALPGTAWEISRKIRGRTEENTYTTYSKIWGPYWPLILVSILLFLSLTFSQIAYWGKGPAWLPCLWLFPFFAWAAFMKKTFRFWGDLDKAPDFKQSVETFAFSKIVVLISAYLLIQFVL